MGVTEYMTVDVLSISPRKHRAAYSPGLALHRVVELYRARCAVYERLCRPCTPWSPRQAQPRVTEPLRRASQDAICPYVQVSGDVCGK